MSPAKWLDGEGNGIRPLGDQRENLLQRVDRITPGEVASFDEPLGMVVRRFRDALRGHQIRVAASDRSYNQRIAELEARDLEWQDDHSR